MSKKVKKHRLAFVLGIRPDIIRSALILRHLEQHDDIEVIFIWSGQHYSPNLKDIFFDELEVRPPDYDIGASGSSDAAVVGNAVMGLYEVLEKTQPDAVVFLGDTNTVASCLAAAQLNIPIVHIEGGMRSYDWRMPEEKYRTVIDHLSDLIYVYFDEYRDQAVIEGINPSRIEVVGNPIVDILNEFYFKRQDQLQEKATSDFFTARGIKKNDYFVMTCHRRENVHDPKSLNAILELVGTASLPVYFPASYRTQQIIQQRQVVLPNNLIMVDPIGYEELLLLMTNAKGVMSDSGTVVEETCILGVPSIQMRRSTERPQVYDVKSSVKFDPTLSDPAQAQEVWSRFSKIAGTEWEHPFGDGQTSRRIADDLYRRLVTDQVRGHRPEQYHIPINRSYQSDGID